MELHAAVRSHLVSGATRQLHVSLVSPVTRLDPAAWRSSPLELGSGNQLLLYGRPPQVPTRAPQAVGGSSVLDLGGVGGALRSTYVGDLYSGDGGLVVSDVSLVNLPYHSAPSSWLHVLASGMHSLEYR